MLGSRDRVSERCVHHDHALGGRGRNVDIVDPDTGTADHLQVLGILQKLGGYFGGGADCKSVKTADNPSKLLLVGTELRLEIDFDAAVLEDLNGSVGKSIGNKNFGSHGNS